MKQKAIGVQMDLRSWSMLYVKSFCSDNLRMGLLTLRIRKKRKKMCKGTALNAGRRVYY